MDSEDGTELYCPKETNKQTPPPPPTAKESFACSSENFGSGNLAEERSYLCPPPTFHIHSDELCAISVWKYAVIMKIIKSTFRKTFTQVNISVSALSGNLIWAIAKIALLANGCIGSGALFG